MTTPNQWRKNRHIHGMSSRPDLFYGRIETDVSNTAFQEGKEFRISYEYAVEAVPIVVRFSCPVDFILQLQEVTCDTQGIKFTAYRDSQGTEGGIFDTTIPIYRQNFTQYAKDLDSLATVTTGGTFTPAGGELPVETIRLRVAAASAQQQSVSGNVGDERGIGAGVYYLVITRLAGASVSNGVFSLKWEEIRPNE